MTERRVDAENLNAHTRADTLCVSLLHALFLTLWEGATTPHEWRSALVKPVQLIRAFDLASLHARLLAVDPSRPAK